MERRARYNEPMGYAFQIIGAIVLVGLIVFYLKMKKSGKI
jgi:hypothetical protein